MIKKEIQKEYQWLQKKFPITFTHDICLHLISSDEEQYSAVFFDLEKNSWVIHMEIKTEPVFDEYDKKRLTRYEIPQTEDVYFFMLYHEYGHIWEIEQLSYKVGFEKAMEYMKQYERDVNDLLDKREEALITEDELNHQYENLSPELFAEKFAVATFNKRKKADDRI